MFDSRIHLKRCIDLHVDLLGRFEMNVVSPSSLPEAIGAEFADRDDFWAARPTFLRRVAAHAYRITTRERAKLGPDFCDSHPAVSFITASLLNLRRIVARLIRGMVNRG